MVAGRLGAEAPTSRVVFPDQSRCGWTPFACRDKRRRDKQVVVAGPGSAAYVDAKQAAEGRNWCSSEIGSLNLRRTTSRSRHFILGRVPRNNSRRALESSAADCLARRTSPAARRAAGTLSRPEAERPLARSVGQGRFERFSRVHTSQAAARQRLLVLHDQADDDAPQ